MSGWIREVERFVCQYLGMGWQLRGLMTGDTGVGSRLRNRGEVQYYICFCKLSWNWDWLFSDMVLDWLIKSNSFWAFLDEIFQRKGCLLFIFFLQFCDALFLIFLSC